MRPEGSPTAIAAVADTISQSAASIAGARQELKAAAAHPAWTGEAATRFHAGVSTLDTVFATLIEACAVAAKALRTYAAELTRIGYEADFLTEQFARYSIAIDPIGRAVPTRGIHDPVVLDDNLRRYGPAFEAQARSLRAATDHAVAGAIHGVDAARSLLHQHTGLFEYAFGQLIKLPGLANTVYSAYTAAAGTAATAAGALSDRETALRALLKEAERKTSKVRKDRAMAAYRALLQSTDEQRQALRKTVTTSNEVADSLRWSRALSSTVGQAADGKWVPSALARLGKLPVTRSLPLVGTAFTGVQVVQEISQGTSPTKSVTSNLASLAAGSVAAEGAVILATGIGLAAGWPIVAGLAVGTVVAVGVGYAVNAFFETNMGHAIAQSVDHAVGDAVDAVGDAVSGAWRKLFG